ncbi:SIS domain-containing protein [uncultured Thermanaerothrix sp.]|uniref:SIS domain-containing protein n=1 Tax=uncultured Thermanaerothrix sp. TaxID=1195149 RepID=UPI002638CB0C|nr:SIS domain-containing protein [uncultured Thermanaerothrix sp.]
MPVPYIDDILAQAESLRDALEGFDPQSLEVVARFVKAGNYDRVILTGMGASYYGAYPAWLKLCGLGLPVALWDTAELLHYGLPQVSSRTLLWVISQSGESAEVHRLLERLATHRAGLLIGVTNHPSSTLARAADIILPLHAGTEHTVSTRTYINTLAVTLLAAAALLGESLSAWKEILWQGQAAMEAYLKAWPQHLAGLRDQVGRLNRLFLLGRGPSLASAQEGALVLKEAAKFPAEGMGAAQFRHGPLEIVEPGIGVWLFGGSQVTYALNRALGLEIQDYGGQVTWLSPTPAEGLPWLPLPAVPEAALPLVEILPVQALSVVLAEAGAREPGQFRYIGKITARE